MADLSITAASVVKATIAGNPVKTKTGTAGAAITAGQAVYRDAATNTVKLADADLSAAAAAVVGVALHGAASGQPVTYVTEGPVTVGNILTAGKLYVLSATAGGIAPSSDLAAPLRTGLIGYGYSATVLYVKVIATGIVHG